MEFEWDPKKVVSNVKKHGVGFGEALTVFGDSLEITIPDPDHSEGEARFLSIGSSEQQRVVVVSYTQREDKIQIINTREAAPTERRAYESGKKSRS